MKAWVLEDIGKFNFHNDILNPTPAKGEVLVKVHATGICGSDIQRVYENGAHRMPLIIGHEFSGEVVALGEGVDEKWNNKRVGVFPLIPCKSCPSCINKAYEMCSSYSYLGSRTDGGFAELVIVPEWNLIELPNNVTYKQAAMLEPMAVAVHAMRRIDIKPESTIAIAGMGTIGLLLTMFLLERGLHNIYAIGSKDSQRDEAIKLGIPKENYIDGRDTNKVTEQLLMLTNNKGVDIYFDCVGKNETSELGLNITAPGGQICLVGNPYTDMHYSKESYWKILRRQLRLTGTWNSSYLGELDTESVNDDWHYVLNKLDEGKISPEVLITHEYPIEDIIKGFEVMKNKSEPYIKVMMVN